MHIGRTYYPSSRRSRFRDFRISPINLDRRSDRRSPNRHEYSRKYQRKSYEFMPFRRPKICSFEPSRRFRRFKSPTPLPRRRRRHSLSPPIKCRKSPSKSYIRNSGHATSPSPPKSYKRSSRHATPPSDKCKSYSNHSRKATSSSIHKSRLQTSSHEPKKRSKASPPRPTEEPPPSANALFSPEELPSPEDLSIALDLEPIPVDVADESNVNLRRCLRKKHLRKICSDVSPNFYRKYPWRNQEAVFFNYDIESLFADVLSSYMIGRRRVMSQKQICRLANHLMTFECSLVEEEWYFVIENSSLDFEWLKKFTCRHSRIAQFVDGMNGNWFFRKNILTKSELDECSLLCKRCLSLKLPYE